MLAAIEKPETTEDEFDHFGANLDSRLRNMNKKSKREVLKLQFEIQKLFFETEMNMVGEEEAEKADGVTDVAPT